MEVKKTLTSIFYFEKYLEEIIMQTYEEFINNILETRGRFACGDEYHERHHILPRCMGGSNDKDNLIDLFAREHFEAHRMLANENPENVSVVYAWTMMSWAKNGVQDRYQVTSEEYEEARITQSIILKGKHFGGGIPGVPKSEDHKRKISESNKGKSKPKGKDNPNYGTHRSEESRLKMSKRHADVSGMNNPRSRKVIRLSDLNVYGYISEAAEDNNLCRDTVRRYCKLHKNFMYYDEWLLEQNNEY